MPRSDRILSLAELQAYDRGTVSNGGESRFCCPLPACSDKPIDASHRSITVNVESGAWICFRCDAHGLLREYWRRPPNEASGGTFPSRGWRVAPVPKTLILEKWKH